LTIPLLHHAPTASLLQTISRSRGLHLTCVLPLQDKTPDYTNIHSGSPLNTVTTFTTIVLSPCTPCLPVQRRPQKKLQVIPESSSLEPPRPSLGRAVTSPTLSRTSTATSSRSASRRGSRSGTPRPGQLKRKLTLAERIAYIEAHPADKGPWHPDSAYHVPRKS